MTVSATDSPLLKLLEGLALRDGQVVHVETLEARAATYQDPAAPLSDPLAAQLGDQGIDRLYSHQARALDTVRAGKNAVVVTGTASGKTLCYNLPVLETLISNPLGRALYLFPTKALAQDQLKTLRRFMRDEGDADAQGEAGSAGMSAAQKGVTGWSATKSGVRRKSGGKGAATTSHRDADSLTFRAGTYDGDTPASLRTRLRDQANILLTNPDMLHSGILPHHPRWAEFFARLEYVVVDEIHVYRGIFGSHVANVLRRLRRICRHHGSDPRFICASATIANPKELAERLTGLPFEVVDEDGAPRGTKHFLFWNPPRVGAAGMERRSANLEAQKLFGHLVEEGYQVIAFVKTRLLTEVLLRYCQEDLRKKGGGLANRIRSYRAGYLPEDRRKIESDLFEGRLLGVISTSALELGIDVGSLDAALLVGYPGTIASTWQQAGRAGRREEESAAVLLAHNAPLDQYLMSHPRYFLDRTPENAILDPANPHILVNHLRCAAFEIPVRRDEEEGFGAYAPAILDLLQEKQHAKEVKGRWYYTRGDYPAAGVSLRNAGENVYTIIDTTGAGKEGEKDLRPDLPGNRVIGTIDELSAFSQVHPQAVHMQEGDTFFVHHLDLVEKAAYVHRADLDYYTQAVSDSHIEAREADLEKVWRRAAVYFGECSVHDKVTMFKKIKFGGRDSLGYGQIDLPHTTLHTVALWLIPRPEALSLVLDHGRVPADGLQGIANVLAQVISLHAMCDPMDLGTVVDMRNVEGPTLFVYDKYPGGLGYGQKAYHSIEEVMQSALELIRGCDCGEGCPSCVGSPILPQYQQDPDSAIKGKIPDREAALILLHALLELPEYIPKERPRGAFADRARRILAGGQAGGGGDAGLEGEAIAGGAGDGTSRAAGAEAVHGSGTRRGRRPAGHAGDTGGVKEADLPGRNVRPLPSDLRRKLEGQITRMEERQRKDFTTKGTKSTKG